MSMVYLENSIETGLVTADIPYQANQEKWIIYDINNV